MKRLRVISAASLFLFSAVFAANLQAAVTDFQVLMDVDNDVATGCTVNGMAGVDQVLTTQVTTTETAGQITRTFHRLCAAGIMGAETELSTGGWSAGYQPESGALLVETQMPFSAFSSGDLPQIIRLGLVATQGAASHVAVTLPSGASVYFPSPAHGRRRAVGAPGDARVITLDGLAEDWTSLTALFDGIAGTGSPALRIIRFFAFADLESDLLSFRFDANLSNDAPFATNDAYQRPVGEGLTVAAPGVLENDGDPNDLPLTALPVSPASHGAVTLNPDGSFTYTPADAGSTQSDSFEYRASNGTKQSNTARVAITVGSVTAVAPVAGDDAYSTDEDVTLVLAAPGVLANDTDANGDPLTATILTHPLHGDVTLNADGGFTYDPDNQYFGTDTFTYTVSDGTDTDTATVTITIVSVNDAPNIDDATFTIPENSPAATVVGTVNFSDADSGDSHAFAITAGNGAGGFAINNSGTITVADPAALDFETTPQFILTVRVTDDGVPSRSRTATIVIDLTDVNDVPVTTGQTLTTNEDTPLAVTLAATDQDGDALTWAIVTAPANGVLTGTMPNLTYTPNANYFGADSFTFRVNDGAADSNVSTVTITVTSVNDVPVAAADGYTVAEGGTINQGAPGVLANDSDVEGPLTAVLDSNVANGSLTLNADGSFTYVHDGSETTSDGFTYHATDGVADSATVAVTITVTPVNDVPVAASQTLATSEDVPLPVTLTATDGDGDGLAYAIVAGPANGSLSGVAPNLTYTPNANFFGSDSFTFHANDGTVDSNTATITINVAPVNDVPMAAADGYVVAEGGTINEAAPGVLANDSDVEGPLTAVLDTNVANGSLTLNADGSFTYVHNGGETTTDSFTYHATDGVADSATVTVTITVTPVNDAPVNSVPGAQVVLEDVLLTFQAASSNAISISDIDAGAASVQVTLTATNGTVELPSTTGLTFTAGANATATMTFEGTIADINAALSTVHFYPTPDFNGVANLTITTDDLGNTPAPAATDSDSITITVNPDNDAPVAANDAYPVDEGGTLTEAAPGVLANDTDVDSTMTAVLVNDVSNGTLTLNADGSFTYVHDGSETTTDSFTYHANDTIADSADVTVTLTINPVNDAPVFTSGASASVPENTTAVTTVTTTDVEGDTVTYSITGGVDAALFSIDTNSGAVTFNSAPDFEAPADADGNNVYLIEVTANDGTDTTAQAIAVTVTAVDENPTAADATFSLDENSAAGTTVGSVAASDPDAGETLTYAITAGNTGGAFSISATTGEIFVATAAVVDFETNPTFVLTVTVTDDSVGALSDTASITINLNNVNEAPSVDAATVAIDENSANGTSVHTVTFTDPDTTSQTHTFAITGGNTGGAFAIDSSSGVITVFDVMDVDFETNPTFTLTVQVTDAGAPLPSLSGTATITVNLNDLNENPVVNDQSFNVAENSANGTSVGTVAATDQDAGQTLSYAITAGNALGAFTINASTGEITVADVTDLDFETNPTFSLTVEVTDDGAGNLTDTAVVTINLQDANEAPSITAPLGASTLGENYPNGTAVVTVTAADPDAGQTLSYAITGGNTGGAFAIDAAGQITVADSTALDFETNPTFSLVVEVTDDGVPAASDTETFVVNLTDVNEAPVVGAATFSLPENSPNGTSVGTVTFTDQDAGQTHTFLITAGNTGGAFAIDGSTGEITVADVTAVDFETNPTFSLTVKVTDNGSPVLSGTNTITVDLTDANEAPVVNDQSFSVDENSAIGAVVGTIAFSDADGPTDTFAITAGNAGGEFAVNTTTGEITVAGALDFESATSYTFTVEVSDAGTPLGTDTAQITINVNDINEAPVVTGGTFSLAENSADATVVGSASFTDPDAGQTQTYAITGGNTGGAFAIDATTGQITVATSAAVDFETTPTFTLTVTVTDDGTPALDGSATVTVDLTDVNDAPSDISIDNASVDEELATGTAVGNFSTSDQDTADTHTYTLVTGTGDADNASFTIVGNQLQTAAVFDYETKSSYSVRVRTTDSGTGSLTFEKQFTIAVNNVNDAPTDMTLSSSDVLENQPADTLVGTFSTTDIDPGDAHVYTLVSGVGDADNGSFTISGNELHTAGVFDFESKSSYNILVRTTDAGGLWYEEIFLINVTNENEAPTALAIDNATVAENNGANGPVGNFTTTDPDAGDTFTYTLVTGTGDTDNAAFTIAGDQLQSIASLDFETQSSYSVRVRTTDSGLASTEETFTITVTDVSEPPIIAAQTFNIDENSANGTSVGTVVASDDDAGQAITYAITAGNTNGAFAINGTTGEITVATSSELDYETTTQYTLTVEVTDDGTTPLSSSASVTIDVNNVNEAPVNSVPGAQAFDEDVDRVFSTGNANLISISDQDAGSSAVQVTLVSTNGTLSTNGTAGLAFTIGDGTTDSTLVFTGTISAINAALDGLTFKPTANYYGAASISITTNDQGNTGSGVAQQDGPDAITLNIAPVNDKPVAEAKLHVTHSGIGLTINAATDTGELKENATDVDDHDPFSELTVQLVAGSQVPANATVTLIDASNGSFYFEPPGGVSGLAAGSFQFKVCDNGDTGLGLAAECSDPVTATFNITGPDLWFVDDTDAAACGVTCNGSRTKPLVGISNAALTGRGTGDRIFLFSGSYTAGHTFAANEHLIGQGGSGTFDGNLGVVVPANGTLDTRPSMLNTVPSRPVLAGTVTMSVANPVLRGVTISSGVLTGFQSLLGTSITVLESSVSSGTTAVNISGTSTSASGVNFDSTSSSGGANGIVLSNVSGAYDFSTTGTPGSLTNNTEAAFVVLNSSASTPTIDYDGNITPAVNARAVDIGTASANSGMRGGTVSLGGAITTSSNTSNTNAGGIRVRNSTAGTLTFDGTSQNISANANIGVELAANTGATIEFTGGNLDVATTSGKVFTATGGGTVRVSGSGNTLATQNTGGPAGGMLLEVTDTTIGTGGLNFVSLTGHGGNSTAKGVYLKNAGSNGLTITGSGTTLGSGGTIRNYTQKGIHVENTSNVTLKYINLTENGTVNLSPAGTCGDDKNGTNTACAAAIDLQTASGIALTGLRVTDGVQIGINGNNVSGLTMNDIVVTSVGDEALEDGIQMVNLTGTNNWTSVNSNNNASRQVAVQNSTGSGTLNITSGSFTNTAYPTVATTPSSATAAQGVLYSGHGTAAMTLNIQSSTFQRNFGAAVFSDTENSATMNFTVNGGTISGNGLAIQVAGVGSGTMNYTLTNATITVDSNAATGPISFFRGGVATGNWTGLIDNNQIGTSGVPYSGSPCNSCVGMIIENSNSSGGSHNVTISNNTIRQTGHQAIAVMTSGSSGNVGDMNVKILSNNIGEPAESPASPTDYAIGVTIGDSVAGDTSNACVDINSNTITGAWYTGRFIVVAERTSGNQVRLPGFAGGVASAAASYISNNNGLVSTVVSAPDGNIAGGSACF